MTINHALSTCGITTVAGRQAFAFDGFQNVADFALINDTDVTNMVKVMGTRDERAYNLGALQVKKVRALVFWARDLRQRQLPIPNNGFTPAVLQETLQIMEASENMDEVAVKRPPVLKQDNWDDWEPTFVNYLKTLKGASGVPLDYVIRSDELTPQDFEQDDSRNRLIYGVALEGRVFDVDNMRVAHEITALMGPETLPWVEPHEDDGRNMMQALRDHYDGPGEVSKRYNKAKDELKGIHYASEGAFPFSLYVSKLKKIFRIYEKAGRPYTGAQQVETMLDGIRPKELEPAKEIALKDHRDDFESAANYLSERVSSLFANAVRRRETRRGTNAGRSTRYISNVNSRGGRGRGGRGGRGFGRSNGRGGRGRGSFGHANNFNGVDITDISRTFTNEEMNKLGPVGRKLLYDLRRNRNSGRGNPGQGRFGRGSPSGRSISLIERIEHLEASVAGNDSISEVTGTPNGVAGGTTGRGEDGRTGGTVGRGFGRGRYGSDRS